MPETPVHPPSPALVLASDGGGNRHSQGAAAAILADKSLGRRIKVVLQLGRADGVEAELAGAILAALLLEIPPIRGLGDSSVTWLTDSEYMIRSIAELRRVNAPAPPDNFSHREIWRAWQSVASTRFVLPSYVRAHAGQRMNESCDRACRWIQRSGSKLLREQGEGPVGLESKKNRSECWYLLDLADGFSTLLSGNAGPFLEEIREGLRSL